MRHLIHCMRETDLCQLSAATFSRVAQRYADKYFGLATYDGFLAEFAQGIDVAGAQVLDVACGPGNVSAYLAKVRPDLRLTGIDLAPGMVAQARQRVPSGRFLVLDCRQLHELGQRFDAAAFAFGLSYLTDADASLFFTSLKATLHPGAMLYLSTLTGDPAWSGLETNASGDQVYLAYRSVDRVIAMVEQAGFCLSSQHTLPSPPNAPKATQDLVLVGHMG